MNEAALLAARREERFITMEDLHEAVIKVIAGPEKKSKVVTPRERRLTAYHEAGHAVVNHSLETADPVHQITIVPRGGAGGMTISLPQEDKNFLSRTELTERIASLLGGRVAEQLTLGDISTGAGNDIQRASSIARNMVMRYGMSDRLGSVTFDTGHDEVFIGRSMAQAKSYSEEVAGIIDEEVKTLIDNAYARCESILKAHAKELDLVARYLLEHETMDSKTFEQVFTDPASLQASSPQTGTATRPPTPGRNPATAMREPIRTLLGDITQIRADAIVNAANPSLLGGGGVDGAIHRRPARPSWLNAGPCTGCKTGSAKITKGYSLPAKYVLHTPGPVWHGGGHGEEAMLASCYRSCLELALSHDCRTVAFPSISTGVYRFPLDRAAPIAVGAVRGFLTSHPAAFDEILFVCFDEKTKHAYDMALERR